MSCINRHAGNWQGRIRISHSFFFPVFATVAERRCAVHPVHASASSRIRWASTPVPGGAARTFHSESRAGHFMLQTQLIVSIVSIVSILG